MVAMNRTVAGLIHSRACMPPSIHIIGFRTVASALGLPILNTFISRRSDEWPIVSTDARLL